MKKELILVSVVMLIIWFSLLTFWWIKAEEITNDPCSICASKQGENVYCTMQSTIPITKTYYPNYTTTTNEEQIKKIVGEVIDKNNNKELFNFTLEEFVTTP